MGPVHDRYDELALGHVLGGLDPVDAAEFRSHLVGCRACRQRVAELRDLASDLAAAEREERVASRLKTEIRPGDDDHEPAGDGSDELSGPRSSLLPLVAIVSIVVLAAGFWAFHLREQNATLLAATEEREATLALLAEGEQVSTDLSPGISGPVTADGSAFAFSLAGLPVGLPEGQVLAVWLVGADGDADLVEVVPGPIADGRLALHAPRGGAPTLVVTLQPVGALQFPQGREVVRAMLDEPVSAD